VSRARTKPVKRVKKKGVHALTPQQTRVYNYIRDFIRENVGRSPTLREIGTIMGFQSINGVMCHIRALESKGVIARSKHQARGIQVLIDEPIRALRYGGVIRLDCGDRVYDLDESGAARLGAILTQLAGPPKHPPG
jgi:repressor LexA